MVDLRNRHFLKLLDFETEDIQYLLDLAAELKTAKGDGTETPHLKGKNVVLIFEKTSTRTRCAFEVAAYDQGARVTYIGPTGSQIGDKESIKDTARVLGRMYDGIEYRGFDQERIEELAAHAGVPVWNGLTDEFHPTQVLADLLTMAEHAGKPLRDVALAYLGHARNNMGNSLLIGAAQMGMDFRAVAPPTLQPHPDLVNQARRVADVTGARISVSADVAGSVKGCDFIYTDVWVSMGEPKDVWQERIAQLSPYQVNAAVLQQTRNRQVKFMHCLPAFHNRETHIGEQIYQAHGIDAMEVTEEVFESSASVVFDQAENRLHTAKAVMVATIGRR